MWRYIVTDLMIISGAYGFGYALCNDFRNDIEHLKMQRRILFNIESEIIYLHRTLDEIFEVISEKTIYPYNKFLQKNAKALRERSGKGIIQIWNNNICIIEKILNKKTIKYLIKMGKILGNEDGNAQVGEIKLLEKEIDDEIECLEKQLSQKEKIIKTLSLLSGIFILIVFL